MIRILYTQVIRRDHETEHAFTRGKARKYVWVHLNHMELVLNTIHAF